MSKSIKTIDDYEPQTLIAKTHDRSQSIPIFILCDTCHWAATYFDKNRLLNEGSCPRCNANNNELSSFPVLPNESFTFNYDSRRGVELEFKSRSKCAL
jgi:hypothetical protein